MKTLQSILITFLFMATTMNAQVQKKSLVAYYSWSGNTKVVAEYIQAATNADIFRIEPVKKYAKDYRTCCDVAKEEINKGYHPELTEKVENMAQYDTIYIGTPNWWSTMAPPVATFLASYDFKGKTVIAFCTHGGGGKGHIFPDMKKLCTAIELEKALAIPGNSVSSSQKQVENWVKTLNN